MSRRPTLTTTAAMLAVFSVMLLAGCAQTSVKGLPGPGTETHASAAVPTSAVPEPSETPTPTPTAPSSVPTSTAPAPQTNDAVLAPGATGDQVRELQARLAQLEWYDGQITPTYDQKTQTAVEGFQAKRGLPVTGIVDQATWTSLTSMTRQPTSDEMNNVVKAGPALFKSGSAGTAVRDLQVRLRQLAWYSGTITGTYDAQTVTAVNGFQAKRGLPVTGEVDQRTLDRLTSMTRKPTTDEMNNVKPTAAPAGKVDDRCMTGVAFCIDKTTRKLRYMIDGGVVRTFDVRFGSELTPTREGTFSITYKVRDEWSRLYNTPMPFAMYFSGGQAVHYSADFAARGYNGSSHGCVNVRDYNGIAWLFDQVSVGTKVIVYRS